MTHPHVPPSEKKIWILTAEGLGLKSIASHLGKTRETVNTQRRNLYRRLGTHNAVECARLAYRFGLLKP